MVTPGDFDDPIVAFQTELSGLVGLAAATLARGFLDPSVDQGRPSD